MCFYGLPLDASYSEQTPTGPGWDLHDLDRDQAELHNVHDDPACRDVSPG